jgi:hypothetical protein
VSQGVPAWCHRPAHPDSLAGCELPLPEKPLPDSVENVRLRAGALLSAANAPTDSREHLPARQSAQRSGAGRDPAVPFSYFGEAQPF